MCQQSIRLSTTPQPDLLRLQEAVEKTRTQRGVSFVRNVTSLYLGQSGLLSLLELEVHRLQPYAMAGQLPAVSWFRFVHRFHQKSGVVVCASRGLLISSPHSKH